ncbi:integrase catalytic domain-containing protein [Trichonephila clavipes]|nr:integrase catalytic domain-containing protein [Trichonephila clavipes]
MPKILLFSPIGIDSEFLLSPVWWSRPTTGVLLAPCHDEFLGPRSDYVRQKNREKALRIELKSKRVLENIKSKQNNNEGSNSGNNSHLADCENPYKAITPRVPEVELYKFGVQSTKIKSEARELIESFPITNENYPLAIESLVERYGRNELLIDFYVRELLKLVLNNATKKKQDSLSGLYNKLSTQLRALSSLGHLASRCRSQITCQLCSKRHVKFMCPNIECNKSDSLKQDVNDKNINENTVDSLHSRATNEVILQTLVVNVHGIKRERKARAIIDTGSQKSYILRSTAEELGFNLQREEEFRHSLFGGTKTMMYKHKCYKIYLSSLDGNYICKLDALDHNVICNDISSAKNGSWIHELKTKNIFLTDIQENTGPIEVLLGADVAGKLITGRREELKTGLVALETKLGWTLMGKVPRYTDKKDTSMNIVTMLSQEDIPVSSLWDLEMLGIRDTIEQNSREEKEKAVMSHFLETVRQKEDGRYEVHMPWKVDRAFLTDSYELCLKRLESTTRKLEKIGFRERYHEVFREWLAEGVIEEIPGKELPVRTHYLPHRPVIKETSATSSMKIRPVFDASAKINNHPSLNDCLETGNNLIESVPAILAGFRLKPIGVILDIVRAFLQISLHEKDRDFVRFLWYDNEGNTRTYRHARVAFGVTSSPFLLMAVINYHLLKESVKERYSEEFLKKLQDSFYVDNCVTSVQKNAELRIFFESATNVMKEGMFDLRGWESSAIPSESTTSLVLGLICYKNSDTLEIDSESLKFDEKEKITKRKILSLVSRVFDPIGFLAPVMIQPKILLQATWKKAVEILQKYKNSQMVRRDGGIQFEYPYFCRCHSVKHALKISNIKTYFWTDSSTVLTWIIRREQWSVFVANKISEIRKLTTSEDWFHISTDQNPADILSRGCGPKQLQKRKWWQGPDWLKNSKEQWPKSAVNINEKKVEIEKRKSVISANNTEVESISSQLARRFSRFSKMIRVMAWILRFQPKAKDLRKCAELKNEELLNAQKIIFRLIQKECYSNEETRKSLKGLLIFEDEEGILRLKSRLINEEESKDFISPIILP